MILARLEWRDDDRDAVLAVFGGSSMGSKIDELLADFDGSEAAWQKAAKTGGFLLSAEKAVHEFLESVWPKIEPLVSAGIDFAAIVAGSAAGPLGTLVSYVVSAFGKTGLNALIRFLAVKTAPAV